MMEWLRIVKTDKVIHTEETDIVKLVVEVVSFGMGFDDFDKETGSSDGLQPKFSVEYGACGPLDAAYTSLLFMDRAWICRIFSRLPQKWLTFSQGLRNANLLRLLTFQISLGADPKFQKDYKAEYKKMKVKLALLEESPLSSQNLKSLQPKNKGLVTKTFDWDGEEVSDEEEVTQVKVLMALADDELTVRKNHACNGEWVDITMRKVNTLLCMDKDANWKNYLKYTNIDLKFVEEQRLNLLSKYNFNIPKFTHSGTNYLGVKS
nr:retrovirus-related Pol polyprotein from transposon TNT 1-94 [Tanacetum cinerariifolium]